VSKHSSSPGRGAPLPPLCKDPSPSHLPPIAAPAFRRIRCRRRSSAPDLRGSCFLLPAVEAATRGRPVSRDGSGGRRRAFSWLNISLFGSSEGVSDGGAINAAASTPRS
jgi:hypothetical protein